ncbi:MAG TPA: DUF3313 family protein [Woeseiaceae bacterium]|nr:DUF3313 family protein [Woeseiaceae bacterium]
MKISTRQSLFLLVIGLFAAAGAASAKDAPPESTPDGLKLVESKDIDALYVQEGATLAPYKRIYLVDCAVAFRKDWEEEYNRNVVGLSRRVSDKDMQRIQAALAEEFRTVFTKELEESGYEVTTDLASDVLIVRPAIVNLDPVAPDLQTSGMSYTIVQSAGAMTLYAELYDGGTNAKIAMVMDARADPDGFAERASRVTNKAAADRMLRHWAKRLVKGLDTAKAL